MEVIVFAHPDNAQKDVLLKQVSQITHSTPVMVSDFKGLVNALKFKITEQVIIVFLISSGKELITLGSKRSCLFNTQHIIILPDHGDEMASKALSLYPRYLTYMSNGFKDVGHVVNKMIQNKKSKNEPGAFAIMN